MRLTLKMRAHPGWWVILGLCWTANLGWVAAIALASGWKQVAAYAGVGVSSFACSWAFGHFERK